MTSILFGILEIAGHYRGKDGQRKLEALADLREASINGQNVVAVIHDSIDEEPTTIKHFDYDIRCALVCPHDPLPWGVKRYFGIHLIVAGDWDLVNYPLRYWVNTNAQIVITGKVMPFDGQRTELQAV